MTTDELTTLLHDDVRASEPTHGLDAMVPVRLGRRRLRARRLRVTGAAAAVTVAAGITVPLALGGDAREEVTTAPTAPGPGWEARARAALEPSAGPLPMGSVFREGTRTIAGLGPREGGWHFFTVAADSAGTLADPAAYCRDRMAAGYVSCVVAEADGTPVVVQEVLVVNTGARQHDGYGHIWYLTFARMPVAQLDQVNPGDRFFRREAVTATDHGTLTVTEQLSARTPGDAAYDVPVADLVAAATGPALADGP